MKVLVSGSSGHLGQALCHVFASKNIDYLGFDIKEGFYTSHVGSASDSNFINNLVEGCDYIIHTATLHKPHVVTHSKQAFVETNIQGTLELLRAAVKYKIKGFIFTSTTSVFGDAMRPKQDEPAVWVTEETPYKAKNIYGVTKNAAEDLCRIFHRNENLPCLILRTSRFFLEEDDNKIMRDQYIDLNIKANEFLYRRADINDIVDAHLLAIEKVTSIGFAKYIISASSPFSQDDFNELNTNASKVVERIYPNFSSIYQMVNWKMFPRISRV
ncbi:MAG: NAD(P)-dependent oxidoreductase, partial [Bacteroidota bacterium]